MDAVCWYSLDDNKLYGIDCVKCAKEEDPEYFNKPTTEESTGDSMFSK